MQKIGISLVLSSLFGLPLMAEIFVYGPGGPAPVIKELGKRFTKKTGEQVTVIAGPVSQWEEKAKSNADIIFSGNSSMMDAFIKKFPNQLSHESVRVLNIREAGIVIRPRNPKNIQSFDDLLKSNVNIMVVDGAGQVGLYEDMALKNGDRSTLVQLRKNIKHYAQNSKEAINVWNTNQDIDALIIWSHWAKVLGEDSALFVPVQEKNVIYRASEIAITHKSQNRQKAGEFIEFLQSPQAQEVWERAGWKKSQ